MLIDVYYGRLGHPEKTATKLSLFFFRLTFNVYADVDNRERARAGDKKKPIALNGNEHVGMQKRC